MSGPGRRLLVDDGLLSSVVCREGTAIRSPDTTFPWTTASLACDAFANTVDGYET